MSPKRWGANDGFWPIAACQGFLSLIYLEHQHPTVKWRRASQAQHVKKNPSPSSYRKSLYGLPSGNALCVAGRYDLTRRASKESEKGDRFIFTRNKSVPFSLFSAEQEQRYNQVWVGTAQSRLKRRKWRVQDEVSAVFKPGPEAKHVIVKVQYQQGSALPQVSIEQGSGDSARWTRPC